jgi:hypothetical protein
MRRRGMVYSLKFFLCIVLFFLATNFAVATEEEVIHQTFPLNEQGTVELSNVNGDVTIRGWEKNEVDMKATKRAPADDLELI